MKMGFNQIYNKKIVVSLCILAYMASISIAGLGATIATDKTGDVGKVTFSNDVLSAYTANVPGHPEIDIVSVDYTKEANGNVTFKLTFAAAPVIDSNHWYVANLGVGDSSVLGLIALMTVGSSTGLNFTSGEAGYVSVIDDSTTDTFLYSEKVPLSSLVSGNSLIFTLGTKSSLPGADYVYPTNPSDNSWSVSVTTIYGTNLDPVSLGNGEIFTDYYPDSDNHYDTNAATTEAPSDTDVDTSIQGSSNVGNGTDNGGITSSPGFEVYLVLASVVTLTYSKKKRSN